MMPQNLQEAILADRFLRALTEHPPHTRFDRSMIFVGTSLNADEDGIKDDDYDNGLAIIRGYFNNVPFQVGMSSFSVGDTMPLKRFLRTGGFSSEFKLRNEQEEIDTTTRNLTLQSLQLEIDALKRSADNEKRNWCLAVAGGIMGLASLLLTLILWLLEHVFKVS